MTCKNMGIELLPPDIDQGTESFSVSNGSIRYALTAIKSVGRPVIDTVVTERRARGPYTNLKDFITRVADKEVNKRYVENFIKAGALDSLPGNRRQKVMVAPDMLDQKSKDRKNTMEGQMSLFDLVSEEEKRNFQITFPDVEEFRKEGASGF